VGLAGFIAPASWTFVEALNHGGAPSGHELWGC